ncbi:MAG: PP2C family protein-serine/threonine phosphatase, partial [Bacillota bacterium]
DYFISLFISMINLENLEMQYISNGMQFLPLAIKENGEKLQLDHSGLPISSAIPEEEFTFELDSLKLEKETKMLFYTDGIAEQKQDNNIYGKRLKEVFYNNSNLEVEEIKNKILSDFKEFNNDTLQGDDDITFIILKT